VSDRSAPAALFVPECLRCRYDLTGLPDGLCPECAAPFTHAALLERWAQSRRHFDPPTDPLTTRPLAVANVGVVLAWALPPGFLATAAALGAAWACVWISGALRERRAPRPQPGPGWTVVPALATTPLLIGFVAWPNPAELAGAACVLGVAAGATSLWTGGGRPLRAAARWGALSLLGMSLWLWAAVRADASQRLFWSELPRLTTRWVPYDRHPLTKTSQSLEAAVWMVRASAVLAAAAVMVPLAMGRRRAPAPGGGAA
jgi:hypothetical protein